MHKAEVHIGKLVKIEPGEARVLEECAELMREESRVRGPAWFLRYLQAHSKSHRVVRQIMRRSQGMSA